MSGTSSRLAAPFAISLALHAAVLWLVAANLQPRGHPQEQPAELAVVEMSLFNRQEAVQPAQTLAPHSPNHRLAPRLPLQQLQPDGSQPSRLVGRAPSQPSLPSSAVLQQTETGRQAPRAAPGAVLKRADAERLSSQAPKLTANQDSAGVTELLAQTPAQADTVNRTPPERIVEQTSPGLSPSPLQAEAAEQLETAQTSPVDSPAAVADSATPPRIAGIVPPATTSTPPAARTSSLDASPAAVQPLEPNAASSSRRNLPALSGKAPDAAPAVAQETAIHVPEAPTSGPALSAAAPEPARQSEDTVAALAHVGQSSEPATPSSPSAVAPTPPERADNRIASRRADQLAPATPQVNAPVVGGIQPERVAPQQLPSAPRASPPAKQRLAARILPSTETATVIAPVTPRPGRPESSFFSSYIDDGCFLALRLASAEDGGIVGYGARTDTFVKFSKAFAQEFGGEPKLLSLRITEAQCPGIRFARLMLGTAQHPLAIEMERKQVHGPGRLEGRLSRTLEFLTVLLIDDEGMVHNASKYLREAESASEFSIPVVPTGDAKGRVQLIMAISTSRRLPLLEEARAVHSDDFFPELLKQANAAGATLEVGIEDFRIN